MNRKVIAFVGGYGSGKTELSINTVLEFAKQGKTALVDLDIVNPYFRSGEKIELMQENNIELIAPVFANTNVDSPVLSPRVGGVLTQDDVNIVLDVGGDPVGATALGQYRHKFKEIDGKLFCVVNTMRPLTSCVDDIVEMIEKIQNSCGMKIDGLVNNTNLSYETTEAEIASGQAILEKVSKIVKIPIVFVSGREKELKKFILHYQYSGKTRIITRYMGLGYKF